MEQEKAEAAEEVELMRLPNNIETPEVHNTGEEKEASGEVATLT